MTVGNIRRDRMRGTRGRMTRPFVKSVLLGCSALLAATLQARADELSDLKASIESLDARIATMDAAPQVPAGFRLLSVSKGPLAEIPGVPLSPRERMSYSQKATVIGILPSADAPLGTTISWSGYARAAIIYHGTQQDVETKAYSLLDDTWVRNPKGDAKSSESTDDFDVEARGQLRVVAATDTSVGQVGAELKLRANFDGNVPGTMYGEKVWGYWAMTGDLTFGGGYNDSLGKIIYGYDGSCVCYYTDNADVALDPGDTSQLRLTYSKGPFSAAVAVEDASFDNDTIDSGLLGVAGELAYTSDAFSGQIAGVWRESSNAQTDASSLWQVGIGGQITAGDLGYLSFGAAVGQGPFTVVDSQGLITEEADYDNNWWGASALVSVNLSEATHAEFAGGYKHRDGNKATYADFTINNVDYNTYAVLAGLYYMPVDQLTIGLEGEWYRTETDVTSTDADTRFVSQDDTDDVWVDAVAVWSF
jgi:hypothetical protein